MASVFIALGLDFRKPGVNCRPANKYGAEPCGSSVAGVESAQSESAQSEADFWARQSYLQFCLVVDVNIGSENRT